MRPAVFGGFDGTASLLGVVLYLMLSRPSLIFPAALSGALSSAVSMGAGEWLSDSGSGFGAGAVMGAATFCGALLPALPFAFGSGSAAIAESVVMTVLAGVIVALLRPDRGLGLALAETLGLLAVVAMVVLGSSAFLPGGTG